MCHPTNQRRLVVRGAGIEREYSAAALNSLRMGFNRNLLYYLYYYIIFLFSSKQLKHYLNTVVYKKDARRLCTQLSLLSMKMKLNNFRQKQLHTKLNILNLLRYQMNTV